MSVTLNSVNSELQILLNNANVQRVEAKAFAAEKSFNLKAKAKLASAGQTESGIKSLGQAIDDDVYEVADAAEAVCEITGDVPNLQQFLVEEATDTSDLDKILDASSTGSGTAPGKLNKVITAGSPEAIAASLKQVAARTAADLRTVLASVSADESAVDYIDSIDVSIDQGIGVASEISPTVASVVENFNNALQDIVGDVLGNITIKLDVSIKDIFESLVNFNDQSLNLDFSIEDLYRDLSNNDYNALVKKIDPVSPLETSVIEQSVSRLTLEPAKAITRSTPPTVGEKTIPCYNIGTNDNTWEGAATPTTVVKKSAVTRGISPSTETAPTNSQFTFVNSKEELAAEFQSTSRQITEVVVHWTGTYNNQDIGAEEVHEWHKGRGWSGIGYHYIIRRDGRIQRGRPLSKTGAHAGANGHNRYSIGVSFAAGYNCPSGTKNAHKFISGDSITAEQMKSFEMFMGAFYDTWPGGQAWGHVDTDNKGKVDPGFDVPNYVQTKFGKTNVAASGRAQPLSPIQLASGRSDTETA